MSPGHTHDPTHCQMPREVMARLGDKWSVLLLILLGQGSRRFTDLKRTAGISQRMLSLSLRGMERDGLVNRTVLPTNPPGVDYDLTEMGRSLWSPISAVGAWAQVNQAGIEAARARYDASREPMPPPATAPLATAPLATARRSAPLPPAPQPRAGQPA